MGEADESSPLVPAPVWATRQGTVHCFMDFLVFGAITLLLSLSLVMVTSHKFQDAASTLIGEHWPWVLGVSLVGFSLWFFNKSITSLSTKMDTKFQAMDTKFRAMDTKLDLILDEQKRQHSDFQNLTMRVDKLYTGAGGSV